MSHYGVYGMYEHCVKQKGSKIVDVTSTECEDEAQLIYIMIGLLPRYHYVGL